MLILSIVFSKLCMLACYHMEIHIFSGQFDWIIFEGVVPCFLLNISSKGLYQKLLTCLIWILQNFTCLLIICRFTYHYDSFINSFLMELLLFLADITVWREPKGQMRFCPQLASVVCILFKNLMKSLYQFEPHLAWMILRVFMLKCVLWPHPPSNMSAVTINRNHIVMEMLHWRNVPYIRIVLLVDRKSKMTTHPGTKF